MRSARKTILWTALAALIALSGAPASAATIASEGFESGSLAPGWTFSGTGGARGRVLAQYPRTGTRCAALDTSVSGTYVFSRLNFAVNLSSYQNVSLSYWRREFGDENHADDGLYISANGTTFYKLLSTTTGRTPM